MRLRIGNPDVTFSMILARNIIHDCLLGFDFLQTNGCRIMYVCGTSSWCKELNFDKGELTPDQESKFLRTVKEFEDVFA